MTPDQDLASVSRFITRCPACNTYLDIRENEIAYTCPGCGRSYHESSQGLCPLAVNHVQAASGDGPHQLRPFWEFSVEPPLTAAVALGLGLAEPKLSIYVPAFDLPWEEALDVGFQLSSWRPDYAPAGPDELGEGRLRGCVVPQPRALEAAQMIYIRLLDQAHSAVGGTDLALPPLLSTRITVIPVAASEGSSP